jgi:hypothetical protein
MARLELMTGAGIGSTRSKGIMLKTERKHIMLKRIDIMLSMM